MRFSKNAFVIVDAYTTGKFIAPYLNANGYTCIHVQSSPSVIPVYLATFQPQHFIKQCIYTNNINELLNDLSMFNILAVIPGAETGVLLADRLNEKLKLTTANNLTSSMARRDKYEMVKRLALHDIPHANTFQNNNLTDIQQWAAQQNHYPLVIKPISSSGSKGVFICNDASEVNQAAQATLFQQNVFNDVNQSILIQQFLSGQEYIVNTVSYAGNHKIVDVWRKFKQLQNGIPINQYSELLDSDDETYQPIINYIYRVLDALDIHYGAGHSELIVTHEGPILIETAARLAGSIDPSAVTEALGFNQVATLINSYLNPDMFRQLPSTPKKRKFARHVFFHSSLAGKVNQQPDFTAIKNLESFHSLSFQYTQGSDLCKTTDLSNFPGFCYLISHDENQLENDYQQFRQLEKQLYENMLSAFQKTP